MSLSDKRLEEIVKEQLFFEKSGDTSMWPSAYYDMARELQSLRASQAKVVEALRSLVAKLDECEEPITAVCAMAAVRGFPYRGPNYKAEIAAACTVLAEHGGPT